MQRRCPAEHRLAIALTCRALPSPFHSTLCLRLASPYVAAAERRSSVRGNALPMRSHSARIAAPPLRVCTMPLPCLSVLCRRPAGRSAAMRHCDAVFAPPQLCKSAPRPCVAIHCATLPLLCHATSQHCRAKPKAETRLSLPMRFRAVQCRRIAVLNFATAATCQSSPTPCQSMPRHRIAKPRPCVASPCHRTVLLCHRVAPNAAQFLAIALQV